MILENDVLKIEIPYCFIYGKNLSEEIKQSFSEETLLKSAVAGMKIEQPFTAPSEFDGDIEVLKKTMGI